MTHKYERECWYCKSKSMEKLTNYVKCKDCGATWNIVPKLGPAVIKEVGVGTDVAPDLGEPTRFKPRGVEHHATKPLENSRA